MSLLLLCWLVGLSKAEAQDDMSTSMITMQFQYQEPLGADGDQAAARTKIYADIERDCAMAAKAFNKKCIVLNISFNDGNPWARRMNTVQSAPTLSGSANVRVIDPSAAKPAP